MKTNRDIIQHIKIQNDVFVSECPVYAVFNDMTESEIDDWVDKFIIDCFGYDFSDMEEFRDEYKDCDACDEKESVDEESVSDYLYEEFCYNFDEVKRIVEDYDNDVLIKKENTDDQLFLDLSKENWIDFPDREKESEKMMKLVQKLDNGSLYIDLKRNLVFV